jgi:hypothetical protein
VTLHISRYDTRLSLSERKVDELEAMREIELMLLDARKATYNMKTRSQRRRVDGSARETPPGAGQTTCRD